MPSADDQPENTAETDDTGAVTDGDADPTERAEDGMAPFIANTGDDGGDGDAATG